MGYVKTLIFFLRPTDRNYLSHVVDFISRPGSSNSILVYTMVVLPKYHSPYVYVAY